LSNEALNEYRTIAKIKDEVGSASFNRRLVLQGLLSQENGQLIPTGFGLLLFGIEPRNVFPQAGLLATIPYADGKEETRDFDGPLVLIPTATEAWLGDNLPNVVDRTTMRIPPLLKFRA
jgi:ATP-dependent DNA helicase RecG